MTFFRQISFKNKPFSDFMLVPIEVGFSKFVYLRSLDTEQKRGNNNFRLLFVNNFSNFFDLFSQKEKTFAILFVTMEVVFSLSF